MNVPSVIRPAQPSLGCSCQKGTQQLHHEFHYLHGVFIASRVLSRPCSQLEMCKKKEKLHICSPSEMSSFNNYWNSMDLQDLLTVLSWSNKWTGERHNLNVFSKPQKKETCSSWAEEHRMVQLWNLAETEHANNTEKKTPHCSLSEKCTQNTTTLNIWAVFEISPELPLAMNDHRSLLVH